MPMVLPQNRSSANLDLNGLTLVVGLGKSGLSAVRTLVGLGADVAVTDSRAAPPGLAALEREFPQVPRYLGGFANEAFLNAARILVSPGVAVKTLPIAVAKARGLPVWGDIDLFARLAEAPVAAVTGSNGKSTVTTLLALMAQKAGVRVAVGGNLGPPALELLSPDIELYVLELSSFQLETTDSLDARVATVLNISADHLDRYESLGEYGEAKRRIFRGKGWMVVNADDPLVAAMVKPGRPLLRFTSNEPVAEEFGLRQRGDETWLAYAEENWLAASELKIGGSHNLANALAALAMGRALNLDRESMLAALREFPGLPHRTQLVVKHEGVCWYDDSKGTNVGATVAAVNGLPGPLVLIAGGDGKGQDFSPLRPVLAEKARTVVLIGRDARLIEAALGSAVPVHRAESMEDAVALAARLARSGENVLLSPACASFDMFSGYEERGRVFTDAVRRLTGC